MDEVTLLIRRARRGNQATLDLSHKSLTSWPSDVLKMSMLEELNLSGNSLTSIPANISELKLLKRLDLSGNFISELPSSLLSLNLSWLNLEGNPISLGVMTSGNIREALSQYTTSVPASREEPKSEAKVFQPVVQTYNTPKDYEPASVQMDSLSLGEIISQGGFSIVQRAIWRSAEVAVKLIVDPIITQELMEDFENEIKMLSYLRHPNTILLMGAAMNPPKLAILTEYASAGNLYDLLHRRRERLSMEQCLEIARQIAEVFAFYHEAGVVHRDLKSLNVLLDKNMNVKMCDFGLARFKHQLNRGAMQFSGTPSYMAPELFRKQAFDEKVDVYAFGTVLWEMLAREVPYDGMDPAYIKERVLKGDNSFTRTANLPRKYQEIVDACRNYSPKERPSFQEILILLK